MYDESGLSMGLTRRIAQKIVPMTAKPPKPHPPKPLNELKWPKSFDVFTKPGPGSPVLALIRKQAPKPRELKWYPDLPEIDSTVWAIWRNGKYGYARFQGAWTYKAANGEFVTEMPIAWHLA
jgi:hypothetical protein